MCSRKRGGKRSAARVNPNSPFLRFFVLLVVSICYLPFDSSVAGAVAELPYKQRGRLLIPAERVSRPVYHPLKVDRHIVSRRQTHAQHFAASVNDHEVREYSAVQD